MSGLRLTLPIMDVNFGRGRSSRPSLEHSSRLVPVFGMVVGYTRILPEDLFPPDVCPLVEPYHQIASRLLDLLSIDRIKLIHLLLVQFLGFITTIFFLFSIAVLCRRLAFALVC
jgi:hypothetical protein